MKRLHAALLVCVLLALAFAMPGVALATTRSYAGAGMPDSAFATQMPGVGVGSPLFTLQSKLMLDRLEGAAKPAQAGASVALDPGRVGLPWREGHYAWIGEYLWIYGVLYNPYEYAVSDIKVTYAATAANGTQIVNDSNYALGYVLYNEEDASFQAVYHLPEYAGQDLASCVIGKSAVPYYGNPTVLLTDTRHSRSLLPTGERLYSISFQNNSASYVARPILGGWEYNSDYTIHDTIFGFSDSLIPPGGTVTLDGYTFWPNYTPTDYYFYAEAMPVTVYNVSTFAGPNGSVAPSGTVIVEAGKDATVSVAPNPGYMIDQILVDGTPVAAVSPLMLRQLSASHVVMVTFKLLPKATMSTPVAPATMYKNRSATIYGYVAPAHAPGSGFVTLKFYKKNSKGTYAYHHSVSAKGYYYSSSKTKYKPKLSLPHTGKWRVRAYHVCASHTGAYSGYDYITVRSPPATLSDRPCRRRRPTRPPPLCTTRSLRLPSR